jgi:hypothetical protein
LTLFSPGRDLPLPRLDDRTFADLVEEVRSAIPAYEPEWTDHNASDPGITLIELLAWATEMLVYRSHQVTQDHLIAFLQLLRGPAWPPEGWAPTDLDGDVAETLRELRALSQSVTVADHETLAAAVDGVGRALCVPRRNLVGSTETYRSAPAVADISVIVLPESLPDPPPEDDPSGAWQPPRELLDAVKARLEPTRIVTTRLHVVGPVFVPLSVSAVVARQPEAPAAGDLRQVIAAAIGDFFHPLRGGKDGHGAPAGRSVYVSEVYGVIEHVPGVDHVPDLTIESAWQPRFTRAAEGKVVWNDDGTQLGLDLDAHHLPLALPALDRIVIGSEFVRISVRLRAGAPVAIDTHELLDVVRRRFHPLADGPDGSSAWTTTSAQLRADLSQLPGAVIDVLEMSGDPAHVSTDPTTGVTTVTVPAGHLAEVDVRLARRDV